MVLTRRQSTRPIASFPSITIMTLTPVVFGIYPERQM